MYTLIYPLIYIHIHHIYTIYTILPIGVGNHLNGGTARGQACGLKLDSLTQFASIRATVSSLATASNDAPVPPYVSYSVYIIHCYDCYMLYRLRCV